MAFDFKAPLCDCVLKIQNKYTEIRNQSLDADQKANPDKHWLTIDYKNNEKAIRENAAQYLLDVLSVKHTCEVDKKIQLGIENDTKYWEIQKQTLSKDDYNTALQETSKKQLEQRDKFLEKIKESTGHLQELNNAEYWIYYNSLQHYKLTEELLHPENEPIQEAPKEQKYHAKHYALVYYFDCMAANVDLPTTQAETEKVLYNFCDRAKSGNSIRKQLDIIKATGDNIYQEKTLQNLIGEDWRSKVLELSKAPGELGEFLKTKQL